ncbi:GntR family transcriptional regulator [Shimia thalassica]|uniref:GntR family transcriptional regulator n=1 Tax=Shimia thalassica TaxID=1715693 RepID=UPI0026E2E564|nr:GntR family transcriptional regulator [Shimia thalassica]MDO6479758.1 GntR family transcriptional regulator [Shimia thalassica]
MASSEKEALKVAYGTENPKRIPAHQQVYFKLREQILFGELAPGQPVTIQGLVENLDAGMTPVREAIRRLTAEGALEFQGNRRVTVPTPTPGGIEELIYARQAIEPELVRRAAKIITADDIESLTKIDNDLDAAITRGDVGAYLRHNYAFHAKLYAVAQSPILTEIADGLWLRFGPSLRVVCGRIGTQNLPDEHKETLQALSDGDGARAAEAIRQDVMQGMQQVKDSLNL